MWVRVACMHFSESTARWLQSMEQKTRSCSWTEFHSMIMGRFGRDQHELLLRQLFSIKQSSTVSDYIDRFSAIMDQLIAYEHPQDPLYFITRFIHGLHEDIKPAVILQRPSTWDIACVLAQLQEEVVGSQCRIPFKRPDPYQAQRPSPAVPMPLPLPPRQEKWAPDAERKPPDASSGQTVEDRWSALRAYRRARGLCVKCAEKWSKGHRCAEAVQLHAVQELLELFQLEDDSAAGSSEQDISGDQLFLTMTLAAVAGGTSPRSMCVRGMIQGHFIRILLDSGSSHSFLSTLVACKLVGAVPLSPPLIVQVANGATLSCESQLCAAAWMIQDVTFSSDLKILPLPSAYDMILGMDWLMTVSPMRVHWGSKMGEDCELPVGTLVQLYSVDTPLTDTTSTVPSEVQDLLSEFQSLFQTPTSLPPPRSCDHSIPLIKGATPAVVRPYRYAPTLKNEIEQQLSEIKSPFSSLVLLVKKKDHSWRFCVDYRHLNAITIKSKYLVPVIDELLDELSGASWFSKLDLRAGFHQIRLKPSEEPKTAFQTHCGQFEFRVMPFGLTGAPVPHKTYESHIFHLRQIFELLHRDHWNVKRSKCSFALREISYLGHMISAQGVSTDPTKVSAIASWHSPASAKELRSFLGLASYYRKFVPHFGLITRPLTALLKKHVIFIWTPEHEHSFQALKHALCHAPVLALPNFTLPFELETDACATRRIKRSLGPKSQGLSTYEKEYLVVLLAVQQWRHYLQFKEFTIFTDQRSLVQVTDQRLHTFWQQRSAGRHSLNCLVFSIKLSIRKEQKIVLLMLCHAKLFMTVNVPPYPPATYLLPPSHRTLSNHFQLHLATIAFWCSLTIFIKVIISRHVFFVAILFVQQVYRLHGLPLAIVSDRDRIFSSTFWSELFCLADVRAPELRMSSAYHPQSDGQTERSTLNQTMAELRSFLGLASYYRKFVPHFGLITRPLTALLKKHVIFIWTPEHEHSFQALKHALCHAPVLALPNFTLPFELETDACATGVGAVLLQQGHPLAYLSKALGPKSQGLSTYEKEYIAVLLAVQQWRHYLQFQEFTIFTDQRSLVQLTDQRLHTFWQQKYSLNCLYKVVYKKGAENRVADALSRKTLHDSQCAAISASSPQWLQEVLSSYETDELATSLLTKLSIDPAAVPHFTLDNGLLRYKQRLWIGNNSSLRIKLMSACHDSALGGHSGFPVTYSRMKKLFAWYGMKSEVHRYVRGCSICQQSKSDRAKLPGLLQPLPVPDSAWQVLSLDFIEGLPTSSGNNCVLVFVDFFTKYGHFLPLRHPFTAASVAKLFVQQVYRLHGLPLAIVSDRDRIFSSTFWSELFRLADVQLRMSSAYHPQSDGQTERLNQTMETFLRCFVNACPSKWYDWLPLAEFWYNSSDHSDIGRSPFQALYGYPPRHFGINSTDAVSSTGLEDWCREHAVMQALIKQQLGRSRLRMKRQEDKNRSEREFNVGDLASLAPRSKPEAGLQILWPLPSAVSHWSGGVQVGASYILHYSPCFSCVTAEGSTPPILK
ncbi:LOW QUALITY PROTEIN: hypothetical protein U9M48_041179 [Paspalum notatum var. saurae]|uniref:RNA-directed DNA polymerase n=1 Tax=Paspalum notatum var. saurae TaxID=547442 RepID=A0AAQ3XEZ9_PASNO